MAAPIDRLRTIGKAADVTTAISIIRDVLLEHDEKVNRVAEVVARAAVAQRSVAESIEELSKRLSGLAHVVQKLESGHEQQDLQVRALSDHVGQITPSAAFQTNPWNAPKKKNGQAVGAGPLAATAKGAKLASSLPKSYSPPGGLCGHSWAGSPSVYFCGKDADRHSTQIGELLFRYAVERGTLLRVVPEPDADSLIVVVVDVSSGSDADMLRRAANHHTKEFAAKGCTKFVYIKFTYSKKDYGGHWNIKPRDEQWGPGMEKLERELCIPLPGQLSDMSQNITVLKEMVSMALVGSKTPLFHPLRYASFYIYNDSETKYREDFVLLLKSHAEAQGIVLREVAVREKDTMVITMMDINHKLFHPGHGMTPVFRRALNLFPSGGAARHLFIGVVTESPLVYSTPHFSSFEGWEKDITSRYVEVFLGDSGNSNTGMSRNDAAVKNIIGMLL